MWPTGIVTFTTFLNKKAEHLAGTIWLPVEWVFDQEDPSIELKQLQEK